MTTNWSFMAGTTASRNLHRIAQKHKNWNNYRAAKGRECCHERCSSLSSWAVLSSPREAAGPAEASAPSAQTPSSSHCTVAPLMSSPILPSTPFWGLTFCIIVSIPAPVKLPEFKIPKLKQKVTLFSRYIFPFINRGHSLAPSKETGTAGGRSLCVEGWSLRYTVLHWNCS